MNKQICISCSVIWALAFAPAYAATNDLIAAGNYHSLGLKSDGTPYSWGKNVSGQLGDGSTNQRTTPVQVTNLTGVVAIAGGGKNTAAPDYGHSLAVKSDGTVWAFGANNNSQLGAGPGDSSAHPSPAQVSNVSNAVDIAAGGSHGLALDVGGKVWIWGTGPGINPSPQIPADVTNGVAVQISGFSDVGALAAGYSYSMALKSNGTVWTWGSQTYGELGLGDLMLRTSPTQISGFSNVVAIAAGLSHSLALKSDGTVWGWGYNNAGQAGQGGLPPWQPTSRVTATADCSPRRNTLIACAPLMQRATLLTPTRPARRRPAPFRAE